MAATGLLLWKEQDSTPHAYGGRAPGVNLEFLHFPRERITFVFFSNQDSGATNGRCGKIVTPITGARWREAVVK